MAEEVEKIESSSSGSSRVQSAAPALPAKPPVQQEIKQPTADRAPQSESPLRDNSRLSREAVQDSAMPQARKEEELSQQFRSSLWQSLDSSKEGTAQPRSLPQAQTTLSDTGKDLSRAATDLSAMKPAGLPQSAQNTADNAQNAIQAAQDVAKPEGVAPAPPPNNNNAAPPNMQQQQQQMMQTMMQMQQMMMQQMQMMTQMMQQMTGGMNNNNNNLNNNNAVNPVNNNNAINNNNGINNNTTKPFGNLFSSWRQGGQGNCASIAVIKAAQEKYGQNMFTSTEKTNDGGYNVTMKDGQRVSLTAAEMATASRMSQFQGTGAEKDSASLAYAAMAKRALGERHEGATTFARACQSLNDGEDPNDSARFLGLKNNMKKVNVSELGRSQAAVAWSNQHAVYISGGRTDAHGQEVGYNGTDTVGQRLRWAYILT